MIKYLIQKKNKIHLIYIIIFLARILKMVLINIVLIYTLIKIHFIYDILLIFLESINYITKFFIFKIIYLLSNL